VFYLKKYFFLIFSFLFFGVGFVFPVFSFESDYIVSNYPEGISVPGLMFDKPFDKQGFRILYHHRNISAFPLSIVVSLQNLSLREETISIRAGIGGSTDDIVFAGHKAAQTFLSQYLRDAKVIKLPPLSSTYVLSHLVKPSQTSSGIIQLFRDSVSSLRVKMGVVDNQYPQLSFFSDIASGVHQYRVAHFEDRVFKKSVKFDAADTIMAIEVGGKPYLVDSYLNYELTGNYGVIYKFDITLFNSLQDTVKFNFSLAPKKDNAVDRAVFLINEELVEVGVSFQKDNMVSMQTFYSISLNAKEKKTFSLITLPQSGCYYPVDVIIRSMESSL